MIEGLFTVTNVLGVIASLFILGGLLGVFGIYIIPFILFIPIEVLEAWGYIITYFMVQNDKYVSLNSMTSLFITFLGSLFFPVILGFTLWHHFKKHNKPEVGIRIVAFTSAILYAYEAIRLDSQLMGVFSIAALFVLLGFTVQILPFTYVVGFGNDAVMIRCMNVAFYLMVGYTVAQYKGMDVMVFNPGVLLLGSFVYFIGCMIIQSKYYSYQSNKHFEKYILCNLIALGSALAALTVGSVMPGMEYLRGMGGTFLMLMVVEKYIEIPWSKKTWTWGMLGFGMLMYGMVLWVHQHPEWILSLTF